MRLFKTLLLWLLIALTPVQGLAAASKAACELAQHEQIAAVSVHGHHLQTPGHGHHALVSVSHADTADMHEVAGVGDMVHDAHDSACGGGAALPSPMNRIGPFAISGFAIAFAAPFFKGFVPAGLERPPKMPLGSGVLA